jgi:molybdate transport system regulatory protein
VSRRLLSRKGTAQGRGRDRSLLHPTASGSKVLKAWLDRPVEHLRDVRTELLLKMALRQRAGLSVDLLLHAQQEAFAPTIASLTTTGPDEDIVDRWRRESARAVRRFLDDSLHPERRPSVGSPPQKMRLSARNQLAAVVARVTHGDVMSTVNVELPDGQRLTAAITKDAAEELDLAPGDDVLVIVKSTEVMLGKADDKGGVAVT